MRIGKNRTAMHTYDGDVDTWPFKNGQISLSAAGHATKNSTSLPMALRETRTIRRISYLHAPVPAVRWSVDYYNLFVCFQPRRPAVTCTGVHGQKTVRKRFPRFTCDRYATPIRIVIMPDGPTATAVHTETCGGKKLTGQRWHG